MKKYIFVFFLSFFGRGQSAGGEEALDLNYVVYVHQPGGIQRADVVERKDRGGLAKGDFGIVGWSPTVDFSIVKLANNGVTDILNGDYVLIVPLESLGNVSCEDTVVPGDFFMESIVTEIKKDQSLRWMETTRKPVTPILLDMRELNIQEKPIPLFYSERFTEESLQKHPVLGAYGKIETGFVILKKVMAKYVPFFRGYFDRDVETLGDRNSSFLSTSRNLLKSWSAYFENLRMSERETLKKERIILKNVNQQRLMKIRD